VNAILRKVAAAQKPGVRIHESTAAFAERLGHPLWLVERWVEAYGRDAAVKICEAGQFQKGGEEHGDGEMFADAAVDGAALPVMDDGSRLVAEIAAAAMPAGLDHAVRVWDCCAAPGGKTLVLAARLPEAEVLATDVSAKRLAQMQARMRRHAYAERVKCAVIDAAGSVVGEKNVRGEFDLILCDVPCSGTGTLAGNPEIRHALKVEELQRQAERQRRILTGALARLGTGGRLVYSTCSLEAEECEQVVEAVLAEGGVKRVAVDGLLAGLAESGVLKSGVKLGSALRNGALRTLPGVHGCDGFFAVVLERE
jgi:16S rRNA (cytosine967-C5)-methyltransferase